MINGSQTAFRTQVVRPGWTMAAILYLGIATGASTAAFNEHGAPRTDLSFG